MATNEAVMDRTAFLVALRDCAEGNWFFAGNYGCIREKLADTETLFCPITSVALSKGLDVPCGAGDWRRASRELGLDREDAYQIAAASDRWFPHDSELRHDLLMACSLEEK